MGGWSDWYHSHGYRNRAQRITRYTTVLQDEDERGAYVRYRPQDPDYCAEAILSITIRGWSMKGTGDDVIDDGPVNYPMDGGDNGDDDDGDSSRDDANDEDEDDEDEEEEEEQPLDLRDRFC
ncbi:hypothetical protein Tco_0708562 [Tanacetum coccineum]